MDAFYLSCREEFKVLVRRFAVVAVADCQAAGEGLPGDEVDNFNEAMRWV